MKTLFALFLFAASAIAQQTAPKPALVPATAPLTIPAARQEAVSQVMLKLQQAQIELQGTRLSGQAEIAKLQTAVQEATDKAQVKVAEAQKEYGDLEVALQKEFHKDGCRLTIEKSWRCAPADTSKESAK